MRKFVSFLNIKTSEMMILNAVSHAQVHLITHSILTVFYENIVR